MKLFRSQTEAILFPVDVACAVIRRGGRILITQRRRKDTFGGYWEFPGGKRIAPESLGSCLEREIWEELGIRIKPLRYLGRIDYRYPKKKVCLYFYECEWVGGQPFPHHCQDLRWIRPFELRRYAFPPADEAILKELSLGLAQTI